MYHTFQQSSCSVLLFHVQCEGSVGSRPSKRKLFAVSVLSSNRARDVKFETETFKQLDKNSVKMLGNFDHIGYKTPRQ